MSMTNHGKITVTLGDDEFELSPTLDAVRKIEARFGGLRGAWDALHQLSVDSTAHVIAAGAGLSREQSADIPDRVFAAGVARVVEQVVPFVGALINPRNAQAGDEGKPKAAT